MSARLPSCKPKDVERVLLKLGFVERRQRGSHKIFVRESDQRRAVLPWHNRDLRRGTLRRIIRDTGLSLEEFVDRL